MNHASHSNSQRWSGRVALVTGASSGIGAAVAKQLVQMGMKVIGCAPDADNVDRIKVRVINTKIDNNSNR